MPKDINRAERAEIAITRTSRDLIGKERHLSSFQFERAEDLKNALNAWASAKIDNLEAYKERSYANGSDDSLRNAENLNHVIAGYYNLLERLGHVSTKP